MDDFDLFSFFLFKHSPKEYKKIGIPKGRAYKIAQRADLCRPVCLAESGSFAHVTKIGNKQVNEFDVQCDGRLMHLIRNGEVR